MTREVLGLIEKLNIKKSSHPDGPHLRSIKELKTEIVDLLTKIGKLSLHLASVAENRKMTSVTSIF